MEFKGISQFAKTAYRLNACHYVTVTQREMQDLHGAAYSNKLSRCFESMSVTFEY
jgi:hypothetical protein